MQHSVGYTVLFAAGVCLVCSLFVATTSVLLRGRAAENVLLDKRQKVLVVAGLLTPGDDLSREETNRLFEKNLVPKLVDLASGVYADDPAPGAYDQRKAARDPERSHEAPANAAKVRRVPNQGLVYLIKPGDEVEGVIIPVEGLGLWGTLYGYLALNPDARTIQGLTFYEHKETPGLGGEVDNPRWKERWKGRLVYDRSGRPVLNVKKGMAGPPELDPYNVDGLSGATITSRGVGNLVRFWLGKNGFGPYLKAARIGGHT